MLRRTSLDFPQVDPAKAFKTLFLLATFVFRVSTCLLKVKRGSKITPSTFGFFSVGTGLPWILIGRMVEQSFDQVENTVALDLGAEICRQRAENHVATVAQFLT